MNTDTDPTAGRTVAPGVVRLGDRSVNHYLVRHPDGLLLVDAGLPGHADQLRRELAATGHRPEDVRAVLLTHAHPDHTGLAAALHRAGAQVLVAAPDAPALADAPRRAMRHARPERPLLPYLVRRPAALAVPLHFARAGAFTAPAFGDGARVLDLAREADADLADLPGRPRALALPGHTPGSTGYLFAELGVVFTGDALVTHDGITGRTGPGTVSAAFTNDTAAALGSLDRLAALDPGLTVLPGHGDPLPDALGRAVREALARGAS